TSGDPTFAELLRRVRHTTLDAYAHQDVPFDHLVEVLNPTRSLAAHPLVQILLAIEDDILETALDLPGLDADVLPVGRDSARLDLSVIVRQHRSPDGRPSGMDGVVEFSLDLFDRVVVTDLIDRWLRILTDLATGSADTRLSQWDVVSTAERADLLRWGDGGDSRPVLSLAQMVADQVSAQPDAPAVTAGDLTLSYHQLWQRAGALATRLTAAGVGPETVVGLLLPRGVDLVTAVLAVSRAGGVFTPLDPALPTPRLHTMTTQAGLRVVVTDDTTTELATTLDITAIPADAPTEPVEPRHVVVPTTPHTSAYVIFTSGSTGQPKGVRVPVTGLSSLAHTFRTRLVLGPDSRVLQLSSPSFDAWVMELLMSLPHGATLTIAPPGVVAGQDLSDLLHHARITHTLIPPTLLATVTPTPLPHLRCLLVGAEACPGELVHHWSPDRL
uniref:AMP-binding protein n=1 Tax=Micromonospora sp. RP3T TaxID=2135446 RepID=UPI003D749BFA